jgi:hypothetical protein
MKDMKMKTEIDTARFLVLAKALLDNCGNHLWDVLDDCLEDNGFKTQKFIRKYSTENELPHFKVGEFIDWLQDCIEIIESQKGIQYAEEEAGYDDLVSVALG